MIVFIELLLLQKSVKVISSPDLKFNPPSNPKDLKKKMFTIILMPIVSPRSKTNNVASFPVFHHLFSSRLNVLRITVHCQIIAFLLDFSSQMTEQRKQKQRIGLLGHAPHMNINPQQPAWRWMLHNGLSPSSSASTVSLEALLLSVYLSRCSYLKKKKKIVSYVPCGVTMKCNATWESSFFHEVHEDDGGGWEKAGERRGGVAPTWTECCTKCLLRLRSQILWVQVTTDSVVSFTTLSSSSEPHYQYAKGQSLLLRENSSCVAFLLSFFSEDSRLSVAPANSGHKC